MAVYESYLRAHATPIRRASRGASVALLALTVLFLLGTDLPANASLRTRPFEASCFLAMLFGLAIAWEQPFQGGAITVVAWVLLAGASHGASAIPLAAFLMVALFALLAACCKRHAPDDR